MVKNRDYRIDNVRAIAMICIILAHCVAPSSINNLRSFDVITLVFLSGLVFNVKELTILILTNQAWKEDL